MIINNLEKWRMQQENHGISKAHLARQVGVSRSYITKLEKGSLRPSGRVMFRIASYFGCKVDDIFKYDPQGEGTQFRRMK